MRAIVLLVVGTALVAAGTTAMVVRRPSAPAVEAALVPVATIQEVMEGVVDPSAAAIFNSVGTISNATGTVDVAPASEEQWTLVARHATVLVEATNLLRLRGRQAERAGEGQEPGAESSPELPPAEIEKRIAADPAAWDLHLDDLRAVALRAQKAAHDRNVEGMYQVGGDLDVVCERCHQAYWYNAPAGVKIRR